MIRKILYSVLVLIAIIVILILKTLNDAGEFKELKPYSNYTCSRVNGVIGAEDIEINRPTGMAFISSDDRRGGAPGHIYSYSLNTPEPVLRNITGRLDFDFHPHGISLFRESPGRILLFVVNHRKNGHFIEIFRYTGKSLKHLESVSGKLMTSPNDIAAVDRERFYVTNDHGASSSPGRAVEEYLQLARSYILYYDGKKFKKVAGGLAFANGIVLSKNREDVYAASVVSGKITAYKRDKASGDLNMLFPMSLGTGVDNIDVDDEGNLWLGCHPRLLTFVKHSKDPAVRSPSQVIRIRVKESGEYSVDDIYLNLGDEISGSSVSVSYRNRMLIGSVFDTHFLDCKQKSSLPDKK
jgi:arylesterase / paraoxonase